MGSENISMQLVAEIPCSFSESNLNNRSNGVFIIGRSPQLQECVSRIVKIRDLSVPVIITGESGVGKGLLAKALHHAGIRRERPFIVLDGTAITETLAESELFGIREKVATGVKARIGKFAAVNGGSLFLDEIGNLSLPIQAKLLRVLDDFVIVPVGSHSTSKVDFRLISATNTDLKKAVDDGLFREDLYYRLHVVPIHVPPLRERKDDIPLLAEYFSVQYSLSNSNSLDVKRISPDAMGILVDCPWPGNVRELRNAIYRTIALMDGDEITPDDLPDEIKGPPDLLTPCSEKDGSLVEQVLCNFNITSPTLDVKAFQVLMETNGRIQRVLRYFADCGVKVITTGKYAQLCCCSPATSFRDLSELVRIGLLKRGIDTRTTKLAKGRAAFYELNL